MNITVYLGASGIEDEKIKRAVTELGEWIAFNAHTLVYGGSKTGLMGILAESVMKNGGKYQRMNGITAAFQPRK